ncbi:ABC-F family ATP-binding cassette domain-containing protein [Rhodovibrionaceae bacterium A322]
MLHINDLTYRLGERILFDQATVAVNKGWRVGLIGRNGTGKTTLLRLIFGDIHNDGGDIRVNNKVKMGRIAQEAPSGPTSLIDTVLAADTERTELLAKLESDHDPMQTAEIHARLGEIRADSAPARAARVLSGLGFDDEAQQQPCDSLSGGWRMRVALASLLFSEPELLLLDEPTNHLDLEAAIWLENYLVNYPGTLLLVSHDRDLLNKVPDRILHLESGKLTLYNGNYDRFERTRRERLEQEAASNVKIASQRKHIQSFVDRFRYKASKAKQAQSRLKMLEKLQPIVSQVENATTSLEFPEPEQLSPPIIALEKGSVGYNPGQPVLRDLNLRVDMDDRIALLGANGNGKSTLSKLLSGRLQVEDGTLLRSKKLKVGYFAQDQTDELDLKGTPVSHMAKLMKLASEMQIRNHLGRFGFSGDKSLTEVGKLSGGEKARLLFALLSYNAPHLLILDEPTNHLDVDAREALVQALNVYEGAVVLVSHDTHLVEMVADRLWMVGAGKVRSFDGDMAEYKKLLLEQRRDERRQAKADKPKAEPQQSKKDRRKAAADARAAVAGLRKTVQQTEKKIEKLTARQSEIEEMMVTPEVLADNKKMTELQRELGRLVKDLELLESRWLDAQEQVENALADA